MIENEDKFEEIIDVTGIKLTPSENGTKCLGNGEHFGENGERIECCCDECDLNQSNAPALLAKSRACE